MPPWIRLWNKIPEVKPEWPVATDPIVHAFEWQPIETAPRFDGARLLVTWLDKVRIAVWNADVRNWQEWPDGDFDNGGEVTHWMRLPLPAKWQVRQSVMVPTPNGNN